MSIRSHIVAATLLLASLAASAAEPPGDLCSLLTAGDVSTAAGKGYDSVSKSVAPRPFPNTAQGTDCTYTNSKNSAQGQLLLRVYVDPSTKEASDLFTRLGRWFSPQTPVSGIGDQAYLDSAQGLHVLKGKARFFLELDAGAPNEKAVESLGREVAGKL